MTTRRSRFERRSRIEKAEERFVKNLEAARDALDALIADVEMGQAEDVMDALEVVDDRLGRVHRQAERMEDEGRR